MNPRRFGLRARVITAFAVGALLLSALLSAVTYSLTSANLLDRREELALNTAGQNALTLKSRFAEGDNLRLELELLIRTEGAKQGVWRPDRAYVFSDDLVPDSDAETPTVGPADLALTPEISLPTGGVIDDLVFDDVNSNGRQDPGESATLGAEVALFRIDSAGGQTEIGPPQTTLFNGRYRFEDLPAGNYRVFIIPPPEQQLTASFVEKIEAGDQAQMRFDFRSEPHYFVALPVSNANFSGTYIEGTPLSDLEQTLNGLLLTLLGASAVTTILGLGFGVYVAARLFSPLGEVSSAAARIAAGDLSTRLEEVADPDLHRLIRSFNDMTTALQSRIERDSRFASDVSHELRSPLMTLTGSVAVLERRRDDMPERAQVALDLLSTDIDRFKHLVEDLLEISRFDVGAVELDKQEAILSEFVRHAVNASVRGTREIPVLTDATTEEVFVEIDKRRIAQVIRNLSENADKYAGGLTQARLVRRNDDIDIELEDEGPGVPFDERELIFERFARGSEGGRRGSGSGVGLGLSLVSEHLALHGGSIRVTDRADGASGARFIITLPGVVVE